MKSTASISSKHRTQSHPARGAWIEIGKTELEAASTGSHPARGAWIEIMKLLLVSSFLRSHPARGAWIEIHRAGCFCGVLPVAPRKGCVD